MPSNFLHYTRHQITQDDKDAVLRAMDSGYLTRGPEVEAFEEEFRKYVGSEYAVAVTSGTAALHLACMASNLDMGDTVDVPDITCAPTANAPMLRGLRVKLYDNMCSDERGAKTMIVHYAGEPYWTRDALIEDAAHALGARYHDGAMVGSCPESLATCFSFHSTKHITCGEGGMVTTNSLNAYKRLTAMRNQGWVKGYSVEPWAVQWEIVGINYEMSEMAAALGRSQLRRIASNLATRKKIARQYYEELPKFIDTVVHKYGCEEIWQKPWPSYHLFPVLIDFKAVGKSRQQVMTELLKRGIETQVHFQPLHQMPVLKAHYTDEQFPAATAFYEKELSLPMHHGMSVDDAQRVCKALKEIL